MKRILMSLLLIGLCGCATTSSQRASERNLPTKVQPSNAAEIKIVSMDVGRVFESHPAFKEAMEKFQAQLQDMKKKIDEAEEGSREMIQQVMQQQMQQLGMQLQEEAFEKMRADVTKLAKEKKYDYVVDNNVLIVGGKDITEEVMASFEKAEKKEPAAVEKK